MQLEFTGGFKSPIFETDKGKDLEIEWKTIDEAKEIRKVSVYVYENKKQGFCLIQRLRFADENNNKLFEFIWSQDNDGHWVTHEVQKGSEIIGMYCNTENNSIRMFSFITWEPTVITITPN